MTQSGNTPMMDQYLQLKDQYPDAILFFRLGDFYEMFNEDALEVSKILEITLTSRNKSSANPIPMCGVPHHSANTYINRLVEAGYKVAICEQLEDPKLTKGMVKRDVIKVITPGTLLDEGALKQKENNYIAVIQVKDKGFFFTYADISTGEMYLTHSQTWVQILSEIQSIAPSEIVVNESFPQPMIQNLEQVIQTTISYHSVSTEADYEWQLDEAEEGERAVLNLLFDYLWSVQKQALTYLKAVERYQLNQFLQMNHYTKQQLELTQGLRTRKKQGSLLWLIDRTKTAMGGRLLRQWLDKPLFDQARLQERHDKVASLVKYYFERMDLQSKLRDIYDLERLIAKISMNSANARDVDQLRRSLDQLPVVNQLLAAMNTQEGTEAFPLLDPMAALREELHRVLVEEPPISVTEGNVIKEGVHPDLDRYRDALANGQNWLQALQVRERDRTGLKTLKVGFNKVFGYYIEISRLQAQNLEEGRYQRKQTLANAERFITEELKEIEKTILEAQEKSQNLEYLLFVKLRETINTWITPLQNLAHQLATLDVLCNFATLSETEGYVRPQIASQASDFYLEDSRHPVVEHLVGEAAFVPNNLVVSPEKNILLLTGPNMSGKSTYMRQIAFAVILNQLGCFVPAKVARLPLVDKIFTRIGSADDTSQGQSTFMVEMMETNIALRQATHLSLLLFDELGRGTATFDGMALAQGILNYIAKHVKAMTIFSTHYHELTQLDEDIPTLKNIHVGATQEHGNLVFLHKIIDGAADKSYGLHVAKLAGLPTELLLDAQVFLTKLEANAAKLLTGVGDSEQLSLFINESQKSDPYPHQDLIEDLGQLNLNHMTPYQALEMLFEMQNRITGRERE